MNKLIATRHRNKMYALLAESGQDVVVRQPQARAASGNAAEKIFGISGYETGYGTPVTVQAWVHSAAVPSDFRYGPTNPGAAVIGTLSESDLVLMVKLSDVLVDTTVPFGRTIFDTAKDVQVSGSVFEVSGTFRSGLAPIGPYLLWVGLKNAGE